MATRRLAILAASGGRDTAYKVLNIATTAASMDAEVTIFFTFEGVRLIHKAAAANLPLPPGMAGLEGAMAAQNVPTVPELLEMARELGVRFIACQVTLDLMGLRQEDLVEGVEVGGAASFLAASFGADTTLSF